MRDHGAMREREGLALRCVTVLVIAVSTAGCAKRLEQYTHSFDRVTIRDVTIVDVDRGALLDHRDVRIESGRIVSIDPTSTHAPGGPSIDARGKFLLPGLADMHIHHYTGDDGAQLYDDDDLFLYLANGVTTVRNMTGSARDLLAKKKIASGRLIGPRYYSCGPHLGRWIDTVAEARAAVQEQHRAGYDCIKTYSGIVKPAFRAIIETADRLEMPVAGHPQIPLGEDENLRLQSMEHLEESLMLFGRRPPDQALHGAFAGRLARERVFVTPTLHVSTFYDCITEAGRARLLRRAETRFLSDYWYDRVRDPNDRSYRSLRRFGYASLKETHDLGLQFAPFLHRNGVRLLLGTDTTWFAVPGFSVHDELELLVRAGLSPRDALMTGTSNVADFLGETHNRGRIAVGKNADLLLLNANPLADIRNSRHIAGVMIGRRWIDRSGIEQILERLRKR